jgi:hypothetical protein
VTRCNDLHKRILEVIGDKTMAIPEIVLHIRSTDMGIRSALRAMVQCGELWRVTKKDKTQLFMACPLAKVSDRAKR